MNTRKKKKVLVLSDHPLSTSGVGVQSRYLINGLLETGEYSFRCFGAAVKHSNYDVVKVSDDFIIKPIDGFGNRDMLRLALATEKPDVLFLFTDPRFFIWVWEMEEEIHQICPIAYWHVWDNGPWPAYNKVLYESTDLVNCHSHLTYNMVKEHFPKKTNFIPHALPKELFNVLPAGVIRENKINLLGKKNADAFTVLWVNRNAKRKRPNDVLVSWKLFLDKLELKHGHRNATMVMHTDPLDDQGSNLLKTSEMLDINESVFFSKERLSFEQMNILHNISDCCLNISSAEGFGLSTLESMQCGKPIIAVKTGGLTRQVVDYRDDTENGIALDVTQRSLVGSQMVPYIYEDYCTNEAVSDALLEMYEKGPDERERLGKKARKYVHSEFDLKTTVSDWHKTLSATIDKWENNREEIYSPWEHKVL